MNRLVLGPGPSLMQHEFRRGEEEELPTATNVVERAVEFLYEPVELAPRLTLGDVLLLLDRCEPLQHVFRRDFGPEICAEARKGPLARVRDQAFHDAGGIEFAELRRSWSQDTSNGQFSNVDRLELLGAGAVLTADSPEHGKKAGERVLWSISLTPVRELLSLPLRLQTEIRIREGDVDAFAYHDVVSTGRCTEVLLGQVIHGVLFDLSFHGAPEEQETVLEELQDQVAEIKSGVASTGSWEDVFEGLDREGFAMMFESLGDVPPAKVSGALLYIRDDEPVGPHLQQKFQGKVVVKDQFYDRPGRVFRKTLRTASR